MSFKPIIQLTGHNASVYSIIDGGDSAFYSCGGDGFVVEWQKNGLNENGYLIAQCREAVYCGHHILERDKLIAGTMNGSLFWVDTVEKQILFASQAHTKAVYDIQYYNGDILSCGADGKLIWHDIDSHQVTLILQVCSSALRCIYTDIESACIYLGSSDGNLYVIDSISKRIIRRQALHDHSIFTMIMVDDILYTGGRDAKLKMWQIHSFSLIKSIDAHNATINSLACLEDLIISVSKDKSIKIWNTSGKLIQSIYGVTGGHINSVNKVLALKNHDGFVTGSDDRSIIIFGLE